ncbi:CMRF35-like molecule 5 isoform X3 [Myxocyprinus asiaticus]|uniref:CMRF35-like molecule 5 isoform X3 n=1 Tax=Myxocyprinus asiaticus TaxID=70543 RepID=UPI00222186FF|nr:CMRF35-like molecule 5 isoform X3 [Myxocyprinus asiaticus]
MCFLFYSCSAVGSDVVDLPSKISGYRGKRVDINCTYEAGYETHLKYFCKGTCIFGIKNIIIESESPAKDERFSLIDDRRARVFTVTITDLRTEDEGIYWCAVSRIGLLPDVYSQILLFVKHDTKTTEVSTTNPFSENTPSTINISPLNPQTNKIIPTDQTPSSTESLIYICVGLVIVVIGFLIALMMLCKQKKKGKKSPIITQSETSGHVSTVLLPLSTIPDSAVEHIYDNDDQEYREIGELQNKNIHNTIITYSSVERPDSMIYSAAERPYSTIYSNAEKQADPLIYSMAERPESIIYSTAEKLF